MDILQRRERKTVTLYFHTFNFRDSYSRGYRFECDAEGNRVERNPQSPESDENYRKCLDGTYDVVDMGIDSETRTWVECAVGKCEECGAEVYLHGFTNTCECGADYNMSGHRLAPREFWGEETGESVADILAADSYYDREEDFCE